MLRAMDAAVSGLRAHQNKLDVIGQNLANVNTAGYKSQTYMFKEAMYQTSTNSTQGSGNIGGAGGVNAAQYGYGTLMGSIWVDMAASTPTQMGGLTATIDGEGFFMTLATAIMDVDDAIANTSTDIKGSNFQYTRVGQFKIDSAGFLVDCNSNNYVYGFINRADNVLEGEEYEDNQGLTPIRVCTQNGTIDLEEENIALARSVRIDNEGRITVGIQTENADGSVEIKEAILGKVAVATFQNQEGLTKAGGSYYTSSRGDNAGIVQATQPGMGGSSSLLTGYVEASNVDMAKEFAELIMTQRGFQANSKMITVSDQILEELVNMKR